ncbi:hypothetical protein [Vogesella indigofera]|uniref:hypothetical protein n=1 Tax=Vogesella indigofera TaxID=45465 RepID=UPI00234E4A03|nr:hypothetical protein [Vogesella indigofera]MDC7701633.1 hypothetical protein [Vogesella indigofera]
MTDKLILWAQALDNASPDHFEVHGKVLPPDDTERRQEAVSLVSRVIKGGERLFEKSGVLLTADDNCFVVEVSSVQRDSAGRTAPIVCYGNFDATVVDALGTSVTVALNDFAKRIGRTLQPEHFELVRASFETLKKKSSTTKLLRTVLIGTVGLVLLGFVYWLMKMGL